MTANVDAIQAPNVPTVCGDQNFRELLDDINNTGGRTAFTDAFASASASSGRVMTAPPLPIVPRPSSPLAQRRASDLRPLDQTNAVGRTVMVAAARWPQYNCAELGGAGWEATVLQCSRVTALVRFTKAHTNDGRRYCDERVPLSDLSPL